MQYRRAFVPGGRWFFTVVAHRRKKLFTTGITVQWLRDAFRNVMRRHPFTIDAIVILPDHLHCIWTLPPGDADFSRRWRLIKTAFTKRCMAERSRKKPDHACPCEGKRPVWQHCYWEHLIRDEADFCAHVDYIHYNPVRHGYVSRPADWAWSSFGLYVRRGVVAPDWGASGIRFPETVGHE